MENFWEKLPRPFFVLAPMEDVTDSAFRTLIMRYGKPDVTFTEFTSADGLVLAPESRQPILRKKLEYSPAERPIVAQLFTSHPEHMEKAASLVETLGFNGLDINMGCPVDEVVKSGCGAGMINNPAGAREIIRAAKRGAPSIPVSVKTRIGFNHDELDTWLPELLAEDPAVVTIHARTRKEMSLVPAHWDAVARAVKLRDSLSPKTLIVGNGDVKNIAHARQRVQEVGCDGVMLGRAIYGNPWLFSGREDIPSPKEKLNTLLEHVKLFNEKMSGFSNFALMKKHFKAYVEGFDGAKELRMQLMETNSAAEVGKIIEEFLQTHQ